MGVCLSCLGLRKHEGAENPETSRLLYDEPYRSYYGSNVQTPQRSVTQQDPELLRQEREALENICHTMSDDIVDAFATLTPSENQTSDQSPTLFSNRLEESEIASDELAYKTIKRKQGNSIASPLKKDEKAWQITKNIMV